MKDSRETWKERDERVPLRTSALNRLVVPLPEYKIGFYRGHSFRGEDDEETRLRETRVISPIDAKVVGYWHLHGQRPESANLLTIRVAFEAVATPEAELDASGGPHKLALVKGADGRWETEKRVLFVYGSRTDLQGAQFEGIEIVDVSEGTAFKETVKATAGSEERTLGLIDFLIQDTEGKWRTARYGIFQTRTPTFKLHCPQLGPNKLEVVLDDGNDETVDRVDLTRLVDPTAQVTQKDDFQLVVPDDSRRVEGSWDQEARRSRVYLEPPEDGNLALFLYGENRIRIHDTQTRELVYEAHFLLFLEDEETVDGLSKEAVTVAVDDEAFVVVQDHVLLDFADSAASYDWACYLYALRLRPQGVTSEFKVVQAAPHTSLSGEELVALVETIRGYGDAVLDDVGLDPVAETDAGFTLERYPDAFRETATPEFNAAGGTFANAQNCFFHHFYIHTFPAHRLVDKILYPDVDPPTLSLAGAHFETNKTFILPSGRDELRRIYQMRQDHASRKMAIFGHTDRVGTDEHNNQLSLRRARSAHAVFIKDSTFWEQRLDGRSQRHETPWGMREIQYMLQALGHYDKRIDGTFGSATRRAAEDLRAEQGRTRDWNIPSHRPSGWYSDAWPLDDDTRRLVIQAYMNHLVDGQLTNNDFFQDSTGAPALFGCGEAYPVVQTQRANEQNRRVAFVLRRTEGTTVDLTKMGSDVPLDDWLSQEDDRDEFEAPFTVGCYDTGFGNSDDFSGDNLDRLNRFLTRGRRLTKPTDLNASAATVVRVFAEGDLTQITDSANQHGSGVMTCMTADGIGDAVGGTPRNSQQAILGTGKDVAFRPIRKAGDYMSSLRTYEELARDTDVKVVSSSFLFQNFLSPWLSSNNRQRAIETRVRNMIQAGKVFFIAAANVNPGSFAQQRDVARTEGGFLAPDRTQPRGNNAGDQSYRQNVATVGATTHVTAAGDPEVPTNFSYMGGELSLAAPGQDIRLVLCSASNPTIAGANLTVNGVEVQNWNGTSFATPMTAGIAAEMMMVNANLQQAANLPQVIEMLEATADLLPSLAASANQGLYLPGSASPDPQLVNSDLAGFRRVHFWKAILAAVNGGIPTEAQIPAPTPAGSGPPAGAATGHFTSLRGINHAGTTWYGFEIRVQVAQASVWFEKDDGTWVRLEDTGAALPRNGRFSTTWRRTQALRAPSTHATGGFRGFVLPAFPFPGAPWWMTQFSIQRTELAEFERLCVFAGGIYPATESAPPISSLDLTQIAQMRNPGGIARPATAGLERIAEHVEEFSHFVFHVTAQPGAIHSFAIVHAEGANVGEDLRVRVFALDRLGLVKTDFSGNVNLTHSGTNGSVGASNNGVFVGGNPAGASTPIALTNGSVVLQVRNHTQERFRLSVNDGSGHTGQGPEIDVGPPGPLAGLKVELAFWTGADDPRERDPRVAERLKVTVSARDSQDRVQTNFRGRVELHVVEGEMGFDTPDGSAPHKGGVHVADTVNDAFDASNFAHTYAVSDNGTFEFSVFAYTTGPLVLEARSDDNTAQTPRVQVRAGPVEQFHLDLPDSFAVANTFNLAVTAQDHYGNTVEDYAEQVQLSLVSGTAAAEVGGTKTGVHFESTTGSGGAQHRFVAADRGVWNFEVTPYTVETIKIRAASTSGPAVQADTDDLAVGNAGGLARFGFEVNAAQSVGVQFRVVVQALDANGAVITNFTGNVALALTTGTAYALGPPTVGTQIQNSPHAYVAGDMGQFAFLATGNTVETIQLQASSGGTSANSPNIQINGYGALNRFEFVVGTAQTTGNLFNVTVRPMDNNGLVITDFTGTVTLSLASGTPYNAAGPTGVQIGGSPHAYTGRHPGDDGEFTFTVRAHTVETIQLRASSGGTSTNSPNIVVT